MILILIVLCSDPELVAGETRILNIASYHPNNSWTSDCVEGIESVIGSKYLLEHHYMDTKRISTSKFPKAVDSAWKKYKSYKPDLVMLGDDNALSLMGPDLAESGVPIIYYGINNTPRAYFKDKIPNNVHGVLERPMISPLIRHLQDIVPDMKKILIMFDESPSSRIVIKSSLHGKHSIPFPGGALAEVRVTDDWEKWKSNLIASGTEYQAIIIVNHFTIRKHDGKTINDDDVIRQSARLTPLPIFATNSFAVHSEGAVGAMVIAGHDHGIIAGEIAENVMEGKLDFNKHILQRAGKFYFNREQLKRFNLKLPHKITKEAIFQ